jgi:hypothetical protein
MVELGCVEVDLLDGVLDFAVGVAVPDLVYESDQLDQVAGDDEGDDDDVVDLEQFAVVFVGGVVRD